MTKQFGDYHSTSDLLNAVANSALSALEVSIVSAAMISVDILPGETIGVSCTASLGVSSTGLSVGIVETIGVSATDLDVSIPDCICVSSTGLSVGIAETVGVSATDLDVTADIPATIGISGDVGVTGTIGVSATDLDVNIPDTISVSGSLAVSVDGAGSLPVCATDLDVSIPDCICVSAATTMSAGLQPYTTVNAGMLSAVAPSATYQLPDVACKSVAVKADDDNTYSIYIGGAYVSGDGTNGWRLDAGQSVSLRLDNVNRLYFCAENSAEKVYYIVIN